MCSRYSITIKEKLALQEYNIPIPKDFEPRFSLAPTDIGLVITADRPKEIQKMHFGLVPYWSKDKKGAFKMINARSETLLETKTYRPLVEKAKRCLVLADGFYEWENIDGQKLPYRFTLLGREVFAFAGLWSRWKDPLTNDPYETFTVITTQPNELVKPIHDRMPVILPKEEEMAWLTHDVPVADLMKLLIPYPEDDMHKFRVSTDVNNVRNNHEDIILPLNSL